MTLKTRLDRLAAQIGTRTFTKKEQARAWVMSLSSGERRRRISELTLKRRLGRPPTVDEVNNFLATGEYLRLMTYRKPAGSAEATP